MRLKIQGNDEFETCLFQMLWLCSVEKGRRGEDQFSFSLGLSALLHFSLYDPL